MKKITRFSLLTLTSVVLCTVPIEIAQALNPSEISQSAKKVTVLIEGQNPGSGVIINRSEDTYTVLTAHHVVGTPDEYDIVTHDDQSYRLDYNTVKQLPGTDLATLTFKGKSTYTSASLGNSGSILEGEDVYVTGFPAPSEAINLSIFSFTEGRLIANSSKLLADGYSLVYSNSTQPGMSGGPVFNSKGQLIGIHGRADALLQNGVYFKQNKNLGIAIDTFMSLAKKQGIQVAASSPVPAQVSTPTTPASPKTSTSSPSSVSVPDPQISPPQKDKAGDFYLSALDKNIRGDQAGALRDLDQALRINPNYADAYSDRATIKAEQGDRKGAIADLDQAIRLNPELGIAYAYRGVYQAVEGNQRNAQADVEQAIQKTPDIGYGARAIVRWLDNRQREALSDFNLALSQPTESNQTAEIYYARGVLHWQLGNKSAALADANESLRIQPEFANSLVMRALLSLSNNQIPAALSDLQTNLSLNPESTSAYEIRSIVRLLNRDFNGAMQDATRLRQIDPNADSYGAMGIAHVQLGNLPSAIQEFRLGAQRIPSNRASYSQIAQDLSQLPPNNPFVLGTVQLTVQNYLESFMGSYIDQYVQSFRPFQDT